MPFAPYDRAILYVHISLPQLSFLYCIATVQLLADVIYDSKY